MKSWGGEQYQQFEKEIRWTGAEEERPRELKRTGSDEEHGMHACCGCFCVSLNTSSWVTGKDRLLQCMDCWCDTAGCFLLGMQSCIITEMHANRLIRKGIKNVTFSLVHCRLQTVICVGKRPQSS